MQNLFFSIQKKSFFKMLFYGQICTLSLNVVIDNKDSIMISPASTVPVELDVGKHTLRASLPYRGNEVGAAFTDIEIHPDKRYEIIYDISVSWGTNSYVGKFTVNETPTNKH